MADYEAVNGVLASSIEAVNGTAKSSIENINGLTTPGAAGATQWALSAADAGVAYAASSDLTNWTTYETKASESDDYRTIAYGLQSGNPIWVVGWSQNPQEIMWTSDITNTSAWNNINTAGGVHDVCFGNHNGGVWIAVGNNTSSRKAVYRSTDGAATWAEVDISSVSGVNTATIYTVGSSGSKLMLAQQDRLYTSTDGSTWALAHDFNDSNTTIWDLKYTNNTWVLLIGRTGSGSGPKIRTAANTDITDWSAEQDLNIGASVRRFGAANGVCIFAYSNDHQVVDVNGKTATLRTYTANQIQAGARDIAGDGTTWVIVGDSGHIVTSTDGDNWTHSVDGLQIDGSTHNLDAVAAGILLPV